jgi:hypothetical protein
MKESVNLSPVKKAFFCLIAIILPLVIIEISSYTIVRVFFPQAYLESKKSLKNEVPALRTDYRKNDFSKENYDYAKDFFNPHLQNTSLSLAARLIGPRACRHYERIDYYTLFPFTMFHFQRNYRSAIVNTNHLGFRGRELSDYGKDPRPKIIILGGSAIFGTFLTSDDKTIAARLESFLRQHGKDVTCINLAMGGYTSEQEMITLSRIGLRLNPSIVIALDGFNDVIHNLRNRDVPHLYPRLADFYYRGLPPNSSPGNYLRELVKQWGRYSSFFCLAGVLSTKSLRSSASDQNPPIIDNCILFQDKTLQEAIIDNFINSHSVMFSLCKSRKIKYIAGLQPVCGLWLEPRWEGENNHKIQAESDFFKIYTSLNVNLQALAAKEGFPYLNFGKILAAGDNTYNFSDEVHLTDQSSEIIAQRLAEVILAEFPSISLKVSGQQRP